MKNEEQAQRDNEYEQAWQAAVNRIKPKLTPEFLGTLAEVAKTYGWEGDYHEVGKFVEKVYTDFAGVPAPDLNPYKY
ncbi:hypothetical protein [Acidovorax sp. Leaf73]|uniref:hypothetical protein n=1 Tax=Acidovorax sp. Leaf73 TaxID=2876566 RepID=UPI001E4F40F3|nr:hypothetical protein [Acidovorax sp. Leaf73]